MYINIVPEEKLSEKHFCYSVLSAPKKQLNQKLSVESSAYSTVFYIGSSMYQSYETFVPRSTVF